MTLRAVYLLTLTPCATVRQGANRSIHIRPSSGMIKVSCDVGALFLPSGPTALIHGCHRYAIKGAPNQKLLLEDIYYAIESRVRPSTEWYEFLMLTRGQVPIFSNCTSGLEG